ncbi:MAG: hypothetical protein KJN64_14770 [Ignavibacteria bacterium]|nr:hypothetical protein [Ignavibacteria bacterium]MBT8391139.1 hypothetical protein [Ignavibacteria bacterium]NNJ52163.1 hypothetical protein [Ignavibacteriaceae bacterium]NNL20016.1 hypothetical protein [Ignavibacteriaceae bacterium]
MKILIFLLYITFSFFSSNLSQNLHNAGQFPSNGVKIYTLNFADSNNGWAESYLGNVLNTSDGGNTWKECTEGIIEEEVRTWSADIFCAIFISTDEGNTWIEYSKKEQEHFCQVYFKDENTGWRVAEEFLASVTDTINSALKKGEHDSKAGVVFKCREYYTDKNEGWTLGWCYRNLVEN